LKTGSHKSTFGKRHLKEAAFLKIFKNTHKGFEASFYKAFEFGVRFSKHLKEAESFEWGKTFQNSIFLKLFLLKDNSLFRKALSFENF
jgi:hypothetical protein